MCVRVRVRVRESINDLLTGLLGPKPDLSCTARACEGRA